MIAGMTLLALLLAFAEPAPSSPMTKAPVCTCDTIKRTDGWCELCKVGYLVGVKIESASFFELLDAHGHQIDPRLLVCDPCRVLYESHGYCPRCHVGFVGKQMYFSKLTYYLARGKVSDAGGITCTTCLTNAQKSGWCSVCKIGMVGHRAYRDRSEFEQTAKLREILISAIPLEKECWSCALAMINDGTCLKCNTSFLGGHRVPAKSP